MRNQFTPARKSSYKRLIEGSTMKKDVQETFERALAGFEKRQEAVRQRLREREKFETEWIRIRTAVVVTAATAAVGGHKEHVIAGKALNAYGKRVRANRRRLSQRSGRRFFTNRPTTRISRRSCQGCA
jgi:hypothetical protein